MSARFGPSAGRSPPVPPVATGAGLPPPAPPRPPVPGRASLPASLDPGPVRSQAKPANRSGVTKSAARAFMAGVATQEPYLPRAFRPTPTSSRFPTAAVSEIQESARQPAENLSGYRAGTGAYQPARRHTVHGVESALGSVSGNSSAAVCLQVGAGKRSVSTASRRPSSAARWLAGEGPSSAQPSRRRTTCPSRRQRTLRREPCEQVRSPPPGRGRDARRVRMAARLLRSSYRA